MLSFRNNIPLKSIEFAPGGKVYRVGGFDTLGQIVSLWLEFVIDRKDIIHIIVEVEDDSGIVSKHSVLYKGDFLAERILPDENS